MERQKMIAKVRHEKGKGHARELRREGLVPAVVYGRSREPLNIAIAEKDLAGKVGGNTIFDLVIQGLSEPQTAIVMVKDFQRNVLKGHYLHIDLHEISLKERMVVSVALELTGTPLGLNEGGIISQLLREIEIECLPTDIPNSFPVDISNLNIGDSIEVDKLAIPVNMTLITDINETIATIALPTVEAESEDEEAAEETDTDTEATDATETTEETE